MSLDPRQKEGVLLCISGPSGVGKGSSITRLKELDPDLWVSVSMTTRPPRPGEKEGISYFYCSQDEFREKIDEGEILEHDEFCGQFYGTPKGPILEKIRDGRDVVLDITVAGSLAIMRQIPAAVSVFLLPPDMTTLRDRLLGRATENQEQLLKRLEKARAEIRLAPRFHYVLVNKELSNTAATLAAIMAAERCRSDREKLRIDQLLEEGDRFLDDLRR